MKINIFNYNINKNYIALYPTKKRGKSKLLCLNKKNGKILHKKFENIVDLLNKGDLLVLNNTNVIPTKLILGKKKEILILKILNKYEAIGYVKINKSFFIINKKKLYIEKYKKNLYKIYLKNTIMNDLLLKCGKIPLPPYIKRKCIIFDNNRYQTVFGKNWGSVAAPTAGLHFNSDIIKKLKKKGIEIEYITLHIGLGTFKKIYNIEKHKIHLEYINVSKNICKKIIKKKITGKKIIACGTSTVRALESAALNKKYIKPFIGETNLFIKPGFNFKIVDGIITNFHLPKSTLIMLVSAFIGIKTVIKTYNIAINENYKFYSYGDVMFIN